MTRALAALLAASIPFASLAVPRPALAAAAVAIAEPTPEELYEQGRKAYRLGKFKEAVEAWEKSFAASDNPLLLYNISLAYRGLYGISGDIEDLKRARAVLDNFIRVAEADPALQSEIGDAQTRISEIDAEIAAVAAKEPAPQPDPLPPAEPTADDAKKRKLRIAGASLMGAGGAMIVTGVAVGAFYSVKGRDFSSLVNRDKEAVSEELGLDTAKLCFPRANEAEAAVNEINGLPEGDPQSEQREAMIRESLGECEPAMQALSNLASHRRNGKRANLGAAIGFGVVGGIGFAALVTGIVLFAVGKAKGTRASSKRVGDLRLSPVFGGRSMTGLSLTGRF